MGINNYVLLIVVQQVMMMVLLVGVIVYTNRKTNEKASDRDELLIKIGEKDKEKNILNELLNKRAQESKNTITELQVANDKLMIETRELTKKIDSLTSENEKVIREIATLKGIDVSSEVKETKESTPDVFGDLNTINNKSKGKLNKKDK